MAPKPKTDTMHAPQGLAISVLSFAKKKKCYKKYNVGEDELQKSRANLITDSRSSFCKKTEEFIKNQLPLRWDAPKILGLPFWCTNKNINSQIDTTDLDNS